MVVSVLQDPDDEDRELFGALNRQRQVQAIQNEPRDKLLAEVQGITNWNRTYPGLPAGQVIAFAQAGVDPLSTEGRRLALAATKTQAKKPSGLARFGELVKGASRVAMTAMETPLQEVQGVIRGAGWGGAKTRQEGGDVLSNMAFGVGAAGRSTGWKAIEQILKDPIGNLTPAATRPGAEVDLGTGFFAGGEIAKEHTTDSERLQLGGQPITTGRVVARKVSEPGTKPYTAVSGLLDMAVALGADPTAYVGRSFSTARAARGTFAPVAESGFTARAAERLGEAVGLARSHRVDVDPAQVADWLVSPDGRKVTQTLVHTADFDDVRRLTNKKIPSLVARDLADAASETEVHDILRPLLGTVIRDKPTVGGFGYEVRKSLNGVRLAQKMPGAKIDLEDVDGAIDGLDAFMRNAKLDDGFRKAHLRRAVDALAGDNRQEFYNVLHDTMAETGGVLQRAGVNSSVAKRMTRIVLDHHADGAKYNVDEFGRELSTRPVTLNNVTIDVGSPHLLSETLNRVVNLPDAREIRRSISPFARMLNNPAIDVPVTTLDWVMQDAWKPMTLLRGAWAVRVIGEEQVRMAAAGMHSAFAHPLSYLGWMLAEGGVVGRMAENAGIRTGRGGVDVLGSSFDETVHAADASSNPSEFLQSLSMRTHRHRGRSPGKQVLNEYTVYQRGEEEYLHSLGDEILQLHNDDIARVVAQKGDLWAKGWFKRGPGNRYRQMLADAPGNQHLLTDAGADAYIDTVVKRIRTKTGGDSSLVDAIATGKLNGNDIFATGIRKNGRLTAAAEADLDALMQAGVTPQMVKGDKVITASRSGQKLEQYDRAVDALFGMAMGVPTSKLSRSVAFKQNYWRRLEEMVPYADATTRGQILNGARRAKLPAEQVARIEGYAAKGNLTLKEADAIAKGHALEKVKALLYDSSERSQFFDITRLIFPFGEAWWEVISRWGELMTTRPQNLRRFQQTVEGARDAGFFHENANGEEVFSYPFSQGLTDKLIGVPVPLTGRVQGLSLMSEVLPGVGPVVQIPAGHLIPNKPEYDWIRGQLLPFGEHDTEGGFVESFWPPWLQKMRTAGLVPGFEPSPEQDRLFANTVGGVIDYLLSSGKVARPQTEQEMADLVDEATDRAKLLYFIRGGAQFFAPSAPTPEMLAADKAGNLMVAQRMVDDLHEMENDTAAGGYDTAFARWLDKYGEAAYSVVQPRSKMLVYGAPVTEDGENWVRKNGDIKRNYPNVYGLFAPTTGEFSFDAWRRIVDSGEAEPLNALERLRLANARIANELYNQEKDLFPTRPSAAQQKYLTDYRKALEAEYPGFGSVSGIGSKVETPEAISELALAVRDPKLAQTDVGVAVTEYLDARTEVQMAAEKAGYTGFQQAKAMRPGRDWLRDMAAALTAEHPGFAPVWDQLFERELADDIQDEEAAA